MRSLITQPVDLAAFSQFAANLFSGSPVSTRIQPKLLSLVTRLASEAVKGKHTRRPPARDQQVTRLRQ